MTKRYTPKVGDVVTVEDDLTGSRWLVLAQAPRETGERCTCYRYDNSHTRGCPSVRTASYWLQNTVTGELYRPHGKDEAVHRSRLSLVQEWTKPTRKITEQMEWSFA